MGMAFTDALTDHADVRVALVDRRHSVSGHWLEAYPFVRLHQASAFYGVASTLLGGGQLQQRGPEEGLQERASQSEICAYYARMLDRMLESGKVEFFPNSEYVGDRTVVSRISGERFEVSERCRIVDARYLAPSIPAEKPPPFGVAEDARVLPVNGLARLEEAPSQYVVVGSGKTATDACIWLLSRGVDPDAICWVRPRDPWMFNRAVVQPDPAIFLGMVADTMQAAEDATSLEELFLRLEDAGIMLRIDRTVMPTMAKAPTLADVGARAAAHPRERRATRAPRDRRPGQAHLRRRIGRRRRRRAQALALDRIVEPRIERVDVRRQLALAPQVVVGVLVGRRTRLAGSTPSRARDAFEHAARLGLGRAVAPGARSRTVRDGSRSARRPCASTGSSAQRGSCSPGYHLPWPKCRSPPGAVLARAACRISVGARPRLVGPSASVFHSAPSRSSIDTKVGSPPMRQAHVAGDEVASTLWPSASISAHCASVYGLVTRGDS